MQIILSEDNAKHLIDKYVVLELDMLQLEENADPISAFCVISFDDIQVDDLPHLENHKNLHEKLIENYRKKNWEFCEQALEHLTGCWKGTVDSFYNEIGQRIAKYKENDPGNEWDYIIHKY